MPAVLLLFFKVVHDVQLNNNAQMQHDVHHQVRVALMQEQEPVMLVHVELVVS